MLFSFTAEEHNLTNGDSGTLPWDAVHAVGYHTLNAERIPNTEFLELNGLDNTEKMHGVISGNIETTKNIAQRILTENELYKAVRDMVTSKQLGDVAVDNAKIATRLAPGTAYVGTIAHVDKRGFCVQIGDDGKVIGHRLSRLNEAPEVGQRVKIGYGDIEQKVTVKSMAKNKTRETTL